VHAQSPEPQRGDTSTACAAPLGLLISLHLLPRPDGPGYYLNAPSGLKTVFHSPHVIRSSVTEPGAHHAGGVDRGRAAVGDRDPQLPRSAAPGHDGPADQGRTRYRRRPVRAVLLDVSVGLRDLLPVRRLSGRPRRP